MERMGFGEDGTPHGMRATFSTNFNAIGASTDVIEQCLAHAPGNRVRAAYNRHAYHAERRSLLQAWADHVDQLRAGPPGREPVSAKWPPRQRENFLAHDPTALRLVRTQ
jgi:hypothetical protein